MSLVLEIIKELKESNADRNVYICDMYPESVSGMVGSDGCFKVPICTSEDYVETIWSLCLGHNIGLIIPMTEKEFIILSANNDMFAKYGVSVQPLFRWCENNSVEFLKYQATKVERFRLADARRSDKVERSV